MRKIYLLLLLLSYFNLLNAQWNSLTSGTTQDLNGVFASADNSTVWVVGNNGTYRKSTNGGTTWNPIVVPGDNLDIFFRPDNLHGWIASNSGIYYTTNGGGAWTRIDPNGVPFTPAISVHFFDDNNGLAGGFGGNIYTSVDGGLSWQTIAVSADNIVFNGVKFGADANTAWAVGANFTTNKAVIYKLTRSGGIWSPQLQFTATTSNSLYDLAVVNNSIAWAVGNGSEFILKTTNGANWISQTVTVPSGTLNSIDVLDGNRAIAIGAGGVIRYTNDGATWLNDNSGTANSLNDVSLVDHEIAYIVGSGGMILKTTNLVLPITLTSFTAQSQNKKVHLNWSTSMELNNTGFAVMRKTSTGNHDWEQIGFVHSNGNSNTTQAYSFTDEPKGGDNFLYQLKQIDLDRKSALSNILKVKLDITELSLSNYPNPFQGQTTISYSLPKTSSVRLVVRNQFGQVVKTVVNAKQAAGNYSLTLNTNDLSSGVYYNELITESGKLMNKISLQK